MKCISEMEQALCTGCGACEQICPADAIRLEADQKGFLYPRVSESCIHCGKCVRTCPALEKAVQEPEKEQPCYMLTAKNKKLENLSASGGFCAVLAEHYLKKYHAVVFGCVMDRDFQVCHKAIERPEDLWQLQGSKYVQSAVLDTFSQAGAYLRAGRYVVYMGTPCQISGLKKFLAKDYEKLVTVDLICHGVPSAAAFQGYIRYLGSRRGACVESYRFRNKTGYDRCGYLAKAQYADGKRTLKSPKEDIFFYLFSQGKSYRRSCYACQYANLNRQGEFTCGDCGSRSAYQTFMPYAAMSSLLLNNQKAEKIWQEISHLFEFRPIDLSLEAQKNKQLHCCTAQPPEWEMVCEAMMKGQWEELEKTCLPTVHQSLRRRIMNRVPVSVKRAARKILHR